MNCETAQELLVWYDDGELDPAEAEPARRHLEGCAACREELAALRATMELVRPCLLGAQAAPAGAGGRAWSPCRRLALPVLVAAACLLFAGWAWHGAARGQHPGPEPDRCPAVVSPPAPAAPEPAAGWEVHVVRLGDTLWGLARSRLGAGCLWPSIAEANGVRVPERLRPGTLLIIRPVRRAAAGPAGAGA